MATAPRERRRIDDRPTGRTRPVGNGITTVSTQLNEIDARPESTNGHATKSFPASEEFARFLRHSEALADDGRDPRSLRAWLDLAEAWRITQALRDCKGNRSAAARLLGIGRRTLYAKMDKLGITPSWQF